MRMNLGLLGIFIIFSLGVLKSQNEFAPIGAEWHFNHDFDGVTFQEEYSKYQVTKDTTIRGQACRKIEGILYLKDSTVTNGLNFFVFDRNDSVFYFNRPFNNFKLLYSFRAKVRDTLQFFVPYVMDFRPNDTIFRQVVDSVVIKDFSGQKLKVFYTHSLDRWSFGGFNTYAERIGNLNRPFVAFPDISLVFQSLRCYQDSAISIKLFNKACDFRLSTSNKNISRQYDIKIYPNPAHHSITLESKALMLEGATLSVYNLAGKLLIRQKVLNNHNPTDISRLPAGTYTLIIDVKNGYITRKITKM